VVSDNNSLPRPPLKRSLRPKIMAEDRKKRVGKACDSCRIKKTKCDGKNPCSRCISDNKVCIFSERKRFKDRNYPPGYVQLLETRLNLVLNGLEKIVNLVRKDVDLSELKSDEFMLQPEEEKVNINRVLSWMITQQDLVTNSPVEWDCESDIAAKLTGDVSDFQASIHKVLEQKKTQGRKESSSPLDKPSTHLSTVYNVDNSSVSSNEETADINPQVEDNPLPILDNEDNNLNPDSSNTFDFNNVNFELNLGGFQSGAALATAAMDGGLSMIDFENSPSMGGYSSSDQKSDLLDFHDESYIPPTTLQRKNYNSNSPLTSPPLNPQNMRRSSSFKTTRRNSNSHLGYISKPQSNSHIHTGLKNSPVAGIFLSSEADGSSGNSGTFSSIHSPAGDSFPTSSPNNKTDEY